MKRKKRNVVLQILIGAALLFVLFVGYMVVAQGRTSIRILDVSGDRSQMDDFSFQGITADSSGAEHFVWEDGAMHTRYYPIDGLEMGILFGEEQKGNTGIQKYFAKHQYDYDSTIEGEVFSVPPTDTKRTSVTKIQDLTENNQKILTQTMNQNFPNKMDLHMSGFTTDTIKIYGEVIDLYEGMHTRFDTGLQMSKGEYYFTTWEETGHDWSIQEVSDLDLHLATAECKDAIYTILATNEACEGEVFLMQIPKEGMANGRGSSMELQDQAKGKANVLRTFSVNKNQRIVGLIKVNEERLLLARTENDCLILELYDIAGNLITRKDTGIEEFSKYTVDFVHTISHEQNTIMWFRLLVQMEMETPEDDTEHYVWEGDCSYVCTNEQIKELPVEEYVDYVDYIDGKVLSVAYTSNFPYPELKPFVGFVPNEYELKIRDAETGKLLYTGILTNDINKDNFKRLSAINIGRKAGYLEDRKDALYAVDAGYGRIRYFGQMLPVHGQSEYIDWASGGTRSYRIFR